MSERKYFVMCADHCLFEAMSKEQIITAIMQAVNEGTVGDIDAGIVSKVNELNKGASLSFWVGTESEYNALGVKSNAVLCRVGEDGNLYVCSDDSTLSAWGDKLATDIVEEIENLLDEMSCDPDEKLSKSGDTMEGDFAVNGNMTMNSETIMNGAIVLSPANCGTVLPETGVENQLFFLIAE